MKSSIPMTFGTKTQSDFSFTETAGKEDFKCDLHWHDCFEIILVKDGHFGVTTSDGDYILGQNDIAFFPPCTLHGTHGCGDGFFINIFGYTDSLIYTPDISFGNKKFLTPFIINTRAYLIPPEHPNSAELMKCITETINAAKQKNRACELYVRAAVLKLHACLYTTLVGETVNEAAAERYILSTEQYIEQHITENISPYEIAETLHISYSHFARIIRSHYGCSAGELITKMKISQAEQLMNSDSMLSITDIAMAVGYNSVSYFTRCFKQIRGCTPSEFRKLLNSDNKNMI